MRKGSLPDLAGRPFSPARNQPRMLNDTPRICAFTVVAPGVRFNILAILVTPVFCRASVLSWRTSSLVHSRRLDAAFLAVLAFLVFFISITMLVRFIEGAFYHIDFSSQRCLDQTRQHCEKFD